MRLKVQNFVCLQDVDVELNDITFFIGEQASGKSLLCKLYFYFREILSNILERAIVENLDINTYRIECFKAFGNIFPRELWEKQNFLLELIINEELIITVRQLLDEQILIDTSPIFDRKFLSLKTDFMKEKQRAKIIEIDEVFLFRNIVAQNLANDIFESVTYIPSGRAFFAAIADNLFALTSQNIEIDTFLKSFGKNYEAAKNAKIRPMDEVSRLMRSILKGDILIDEKSAWLVSQNIPRPLAYTSSGQQEALPLLLVLCHLMDLSVLWGSHSIVIEEPEAHLFPTAQKAIVDLLFYVRHYGQAKKLLITTHSPYILSCANNALLKNPDIKVNAYYLANGTAKRIMDDEVGLIDGIDLDGVSYQIAEEFDELLAKSDNHG